MSAVLWGYHKSTSCCGLTEFHDLRSSNPKLYFVDRQDKRWLRRGKAYFATTIPEMKKEIKRLRKLGYKRVGRWHNSNTDTMVSMWLWTYEAQHKRRKK